MIKLSSETTSASSAVCQSRMCFTKLFLLKMGFEISGWRFLKFWFFNADFYCITVFVNVTHHPV